MLNPLSRIRLANLIRLFVVVGLIFIFSGNVNAQFDGGGGSCTINPVSPCFKTSDTADCQCGGSNDQYVCALVGNSCQPVNYPLVDNTDPGEGGTTTPSEAPEYGQWSPPISEWTQVDWGNNTASGGNQVTIYEQGSFYFYLNQSGPPPQGDEFCIFVHI